MRFPERITVDGVERPARNSAGAPIHPSILGVRNFWRWFGESQAVDAQGRPLVLYHGTPEDIDAFKVPKKKGMFGQGVYLTSDPSLADGFAESCGGNVMPVYARQADIYKKVLYLVSDPAQIKSALGNSGLFSVNSASLTDGDCPCFAPFPASVFHGTNAVFSAFDLSLADPDEAGVFFTDARAQAAEYGDRVMEAAVSLKHPYLADYADWQWGDLPSAAALQTAGHDGVIVLDFDGQAARYADQAASPIAWCVFDAEAITVVGETQVLPDRRLPVMTPSNEAGVPIALSGTALEADRFLVVTLAPDRHAFTQEDAELEVARLLREVAQLPDWPELSASPSALDDEFPVSLPETLMVDGKERPARNSLGAPIHPSVMGVRNFWRWFGESQTIDGQGRPRVFYHGTREDIDAFDPSAIKRRFPYSFGLHFTDRTEEASIYATEIDDQKPVPPGANIVPAYLKTTQSMVILTDQMTASMEADLNRAEIVARRLAAIAAGRPFDGVIISRLRGDEWDGRNAIVFEANQVKSALGNSGAFDPQSASLTDDDCPALSARAAPVALHDINGRVIGQASVMASVPPPPEGAFQVVIALTPPQSLGVAAGYDEARHLLCRAAERVAAGDRAFLLATSGEEGARRVVQAAFNGPARDLDDDLAWTHDGARVSHTGLSAPESGFSGFEVVLPTGETHCVFAEHAEDAIVQARERSLGASAADRGMFA